ncbi:hypothetical protein [uncultured Clostridium sp.]|uniref:hypothetical protein n=1 Tax=uncultured Clostridium sp. TaxID=59620 RepID=UPI0026250FCE|nr:hypothetical protein [uncultured Clostridium sp.]
MLGMTLCSIRVKNKKLIEMYFYDRTTSQQILSITKRSYNTYTQINGVITRNDGAVYIYSQNGLVRVNDSRTYTAKICDRNNLPDIVYTAYYFLYNSNALSDYRDYYHYNIRNLNIVSLHKLFKEINNVKDQKSYVDTIKPKLIQKDI